MRREDQLYELALIAVEKAEKELKDKQGKLEDALLQKECQDHEFEVFESMFHNNDIKTEKCKLCGYVNAEQKQRDLL